MCLSDKHCLKCDGARAETRFRLSAKRTSLFKSAGASVQSTTGSRGMLISGSNAGYTMFRGSVKGTGYPLHSPVFLSRPHPCVTVCHQISTGRYTPERARPRAVGWQNVQSGWGLTNIKRLVCVLKPSRDFVISKSTKLYRISVQYSVLTLSISGFGGLEVPCWPLVPKFAGSNPAEAVGFLRVNKNPQHVGGHGCLSVVIVVCCQIEVSATG